MVPNRSVVLALLSVCMLAGSDAAAQTASEWIPYEGILEEGGEPVSGPMSFRFYICDTDAEVDETACPYEQGADPDALPDPVIGTALWYEEHSSTTSAPVDVFSGQFHALLGSQTPLAATLENRSSNALYIAVAVQDPSTDEPWVLLRGRQAIGTVQYARGGAPGTDFYVDGSLTTSADTSAGGDVSAGGNLSVGAAITAPEGTLRDDGGGWVRTYGATGWYSQTYDGGWYMSDATWVRSYNSKSVYTGTGTLRTDGDLQATNNSHGSCTNVPANIPSIRYNSDDMVGHLLTMCPAGMYMVGLYSQHYQEGSNFRDRWVTYIRCCDL